MDAFVDRVSNEMMLLVDGLERAYDIGMRLHGLGMDGAVDESTRALAVPLWLIWGSLTDRVDGPRGGDAGAEEAAAGDMRRAAAEWLNVANDPERRAAYLDKWVYEECGYERTEEAR